MRIFRATAGSVSGEMDKDQETNNHMGAPGKGRWRWETQMGAQTDSDGQSGCLKHPCLPPCCQNLGDVSQAPLHQYWGAKSWCRGWSDPTSTRSSSAMTSRDSQCQENARGAAQDPGCALTTVPMGGVRAQADIAGNQQLWEGGADLLDGLDGRSVLCISSRALLIL